MNASRALLGIYVRGDTAWHRMGVGPKYLILLAVTLPAVVFRDPVLTLAMLGIAAALAASTRAPLRLAWGLPVPIVVLLVILAAFHVLSGRPVEAVLVVGAMLTALYTSRFLLITTPMPQLVDALVACARPFRPLGAKPERFGLAVALLVRSVPQVAASFGEVRDAARARGLERNPLASLTPVVIQTVAYARTTGDALMARGLGDDD